MSRPGSSTRLRRILALVPWVAANQGPTVQEVCERFDYREQDLIADLELLFVCGLYPFTPDTLMEADIADGRVWIDYADYFSRPLRLTPAEGLAVLAAGNTLLAAPGSDPSGPLARGLAKLSSVLGVDLDEAIEVELAPVSESLLNTMETAHKESRRVEIDYYSYGRDQWTKRQIDPYRLFNSAGQWYVNGYCHKVKDTRLFRLDRIKSATLLDEHFEVPATQAKLGDQDAVFSPNSNDPLFALELGSVDRWVCEYYPNEGVTELGDGHFRVCLRISETGWLERLLLRLGTGVNIAEGDPEIQCKAATRVLSRYE